MPPSARFPAAIATMASLALAEPFFQRRPSLTFPIPGGRIPTEQAKAYPIQAEGLDSFDLEILAALPEALIPANPKFTPVETRRIRKPAQAGLRWTHLLDLDSLSRSLDGVYLELHGIVPQGWLPSNDPPDADASTHVLMEATEDPMKTHFIEARKAIQVQGPMAIITRLEPSSRRVTVFDPSTGKPLEGAGVSLIPGRFGDPDGWTDATGSVDLPLSGGNTVLIRHERTFERFQIAPIHTPDGSFYKRLQGEAWDDVPADRIVPAPPPVEFRPDRIVRPFLHKTAYRPGDSLLVECFVRTEASNTLPLELEIEAPRGATFPAVKREFGVKPLEHVQWRWRIPDSAPAGEWRIGASLGTTWGGFPFVVRSQPSRLRPLTVSIHDRGPSRFPALSVRTTAPVPGSGSDSVKWRLRFQEEPPSDQKLVDDPRFCRNQRISQPNRPLLGIDTSLRTPLDRDGTASEGIDAQDTTFFWRRGSFRADVALEPVHGRAIVEVVQNLPLAWGREPRIHFQATPTHLRVTGVVVGIDGTIHDGIPLRLRARSSLLQARQVDTCIPSGTTVDLPVRQRPAGSGTPSLDPDMQVDLSVRNRPGAQVQARLPMRDDRKTGDWKPLDDLSQPWRPEPRIRRQEAPSGSPARSPSGAETPSTGIVSEIAPGDTVVASWEALSPSPALVQVIGADRILEQRSVVSQVGVNRLPVRVLPSWTGFVDLVVHRFDPSIRSPGTDALSIWRRRFHVGRPRPEPPRLGVSKIPGSSDSLRLVLHNPARTPWTASLFWSTSATDPADFADLPRPEEFEHYEPAAKVSWWSPGSRPIEFRHCLLGSGGFPGSEIQGDQEAGWWEYPNDIPYVRTQPDPDPPDPRRAGVGAPHDRVWLGVPQRPTADSLSVDIAIPEGVDRLRVGATGITGTAVLSLDTIVDIRYREPMAMELPQILSVDDTAWAFVRFPRELGGRSARLSFQGPVEIRGSRGRTLEWTVPTDGRSVVEIHALQSGLATLELRVEGSSTPAVRSRILVPGRKPRLSSRAETAESRQFQSLSLPSRPRRLDSTVLAVSPLDDWRAPDALRSELFRSRWDGTENTLAESWKGLYTDLLFPGQPRDSVRARNDKLVPLVKRAIQDAYVFQEYDVHGTGRADIWWALALRTFLADAGDRGFGISQRSLPDLDTGIRTLPENDLDPIAHALFLSMAAVPADSGRLARLEAKSPGATACHLASKGWARAGFPGRSLALAGKCPSFSDEILPWSMHSGDRMRILSIQAWAALGAGKVAQAQPILEALCEGIADGDDLWNGWVPRTLHLAKETCGLRSAKPKVHWRTDSGPWRPLMLVDGKGRSRLPRNATGVQLRWTGGENRRLHAQLVGYGDFEFPAIASRTDLELEWSVEGKRCDRLPDTLHLDDEIVLRATIRNRANQAIGGRLEVRLPGGWMFPLDRDLNLGGTNPAFGQAGEAEAMTNTVQEGFQVEAFHSQQRDFALRASIPGIFHGGQVRFWSALESDLLAEISLPRTVVLPTRRPLTQGRTP
ncbi:MAG TPA: hypothetical protein PKY05_04820 [Fibrobacteria bacterium]|nr:hypothetical protein [Fibrobacteria bacterium]